MSRAQEDDVDRLIAAWRRERPDMDVSPMQVLSRVTRLALHLDRARKQAFADHDLESSEFDVLSALRRAGKPYQLSPGQLVQETLVTSGTMTNRVDRLVSKGLVERLPDPADRRGVQVRLTAPGRVAVDGAIDAFSSTSTNCSTVSPPRKPSLSPTPCVRFRARSTTDIRPAAAT